MGEVYRAFDLRAEVDAPDREVALKMILRRRSGVPIDPRENAAKAKRFAREVRIMRRLDHPNLPRTIDGGVDDEHGGLPYLVMELLDGHTLAELIAEAGRLPVGWTAAIGAQIAAGLDAAHAEGVIHRDLKPTNIMLVRGGTVKVLDFGAGHLLDDADEDRLTSTGRTIGTARYMAPEQFDASRVTPSADLYALGCVLYEMLAGTPPVQGENFYEFVAKHLSDERPAPLILIREDVPKELARLVERLLAKRPADRPADAMTVQDVLLPLAEQPNQGGGVAGWEEFDPLPGPVLGREAGRKAWTEGLPTGPGQAAASADGISADAPSGMDLFGLHRKLIDDYRDFTEGGTVIRDERITAFVQDDLDGKSQWPDPWVSLNPFFASAGTVTELVAKDALHPLCAKIFQAGKTPGGTVCDGRPLSLYRHQVQAIEAAGKGASYVLTTGTGSGKSLGYIVPIVDRVLRERDAEGPAGRKRVRAVIVYPMNALANSQLNELKKFLRDGFGEGREPVTFARYTGQEDLARRKEIRDNPPDILLTNYVMLELMLTRPDDRRSLIRMAEGLEFLVFDELHTYRGRQGADVALLSRRVRQACRAERLQCIGTSATISTEGSFAEQQKAVAELAGTLFGERIGPENVIGETLVRATAVSPETVRAARLDGTQEAPRSYEELVRDPLARWVETHFGLAADPSGRLVRRAPTRIEDAARTLAGASGVPEERCVLAIQQTLEAGSQALNPDTERPLFAFRLHQFLSKGDTVYVTLENPELRHLTRTYQREQPGSGGKLLMPLAFCRECGQEYLTVWRIEQDGRTVYQPRRDTTATGGRSDDGYLFVGPDHPWPATPEEAIAERRLPESWVEIDGRGQETVKQTFRDRVPRKVTVDPYGVEGHGELGAAFVPAPFLFCLNCGVSYEQTRGRDFAKLATLGQEGRSSATTLVSASIVRTLREIPEQSLKPEARKLLAFVDNRQDASLQAGHFNDFAQVTQLRGALYRAAVEAGAEGITHEELASAVVGALNLGPADYAGREELPPNLLRNAARTLRDVVAYRLYLDLQRGWRVTMPNLEQTGLLEIHYPDLPWLAAKESAWSGTVTALKDADGGLRAEIIKALLDEMRRALAIDVQHFREDFDTLQRASEERLTDPWQLTGTDSPTVGTAYPQSSRPGMDRSGLFLSARGKFGKYLRRADWAFAELGPEELQLAVKQLLEVLADIGLVTRIDESPRYVRSHRRRSGPAVTGYRVSAATLVWKAGRGTTGAHDPLTRTYATGEGPRVNTFFRDLYRDTAASLAGLFALEHTAQVDPTRREQREEDFRKAELKLLYCSPTMELGVDIAELNAVLMRNVPPTPANYVQRSGRAGRSGQPALVTTYCSTGNSHDQYYFRRSERMVAGAVVPPRLELANEDLILAHVQGIWLAEAGLKLGRAVPEVIDVGYPEGSGRPAPGLALHAHIASVLHDEGVRRRTVAAADAVLGRLRPTFAETAWWDESWVEERVHTAAERFDRAFDRWRGLFRAALEDQFTQNRRVLDHTLTERDRREAGSRRKQAETQLNLLKNEAADSRSVLSDFNPYRYLASQGFLPGYSFPRLPLAAYIPASDRRSNDGDYLQRPRFLAIREFGPGALIYHEGARYQVTRIQLPPESAGDLTTESARRCENCGYHHPAEEREDCCRLCAQPLGNATYGLLHLHTVYTTRRERISSDEEERRRAGYRLVTSYRFQQHGLRTGRRDARIQDGAGKIATLSYGDSAIVRIANLGRVRAKPNEPDGFWLDPGDGRWLNAKAAADASGDSSDLPVVDADGNEKRRRKLVIPFVQDHRNIVVLTLDQPLDESVAVSLMFALERGIEAAFELEDAELISELLPPEGGPRDRMLFAEASEGGAGVLRRLQAERDALAAAAQQALTICHFDKHGRDLATSGDRACARGCYDCLLTYGNQLHHAAIDRHSVRDLLLRMAACKAESTGIGESRTGQEKRLTGQSDSSLEREFVTWLKENGFRLPDEAQTFVPEALARPDFVYRLPGATVAVFIDGPVHGTAAVAERDAEAAERLCDEGWDVVRFRYDKDWGEIADRHARYFGTRRGTR